MKVVRVLPSCFQEENGLKVHFVTEDYAEAVARDLQSRTDGTVTTEEFPKGFYFDFGGVRVLSLTVPEIEVRGVTIKFPATHIELLQARIEKDLQRGDQGRGYVKVYMPLHCYVASEEFWQEVCKELKANASSIRERFEREWAEWAIGLGKED